MNYKKKIKENYENKLNNFDDSDNYKYKFEYLENLIKEFQKIDKSINLFDNYNHRIYRIRLKVQELWSDFNLMPGRNKADAQVPSLGLNNVEVKTMNAKIENIKSFFNKKFMFDKQDRVGRREYILKNDGLVFAIFLNEILFWIFWTSDKKTLEEYRNLVIIKQEKFVKYFEEAQKKSGNGGFDTINIAVSEFSDESIWNFYYKEKTYENKKLLDIKKIIKI